VEIGRGKRENGNIIAINVSRLRAAECRGLGNENNTRSIEWRLKEDLVETVSSVDTPMRHRRHYNTMVVDRCEGGCCWLFFSATSS
jgi:hypothetical protein